MSPKNRIIVKQCQVDVFERALAIGRHPHSGRAIAKMSDMNGTKSMKRPPPVIPHVLSNIVPLSNILKFHSQNAYRQIVTAIEALASSPDEPDVIRKRRLLSVIVSVRQDLLKLYTLVKWAANSKAVSTLIDLLNWLRTYESHFDAFCFHLNTLNGFSGAKLPALDIVTALHVLFKGRPQLPSYNYIGAPPISPQMTLRVLRDLNIVLATRLALLSLPEKFASSYTVADGRARFVVQNEFEVCLTVVSNEIVESDNDLSSPFYFVDFKFLFGIDIDSDSVSHHGSSITTRLPRASQENLEKLSNVTLARRGLHGLYDLLHKYAISFKLYLLAKELKQLCSGAKWRGNLQYSYHTGKSLIVINYCSSHFLSRNWKSFVEIGIDANIQLCIRWFKDGQYKIDPEFASIFGETIAPDLGANSNSCQGDENVSIDWIMTTIVNKHARLMILAVHDRLLETIGTLVAPPQVSFIAPHQLVIALSPQKTLSFAIDPCTGQFYFSNPTPLQLQITKKINWATPAQLSSNAFVSERDAVCFIVDCLIQLRLETYKRELDHRLATLEWIPNSIITLKNSEASKILESVPLAFKSSSFVKINYYRRRSWPSSWFMINCLSGISLDSRWWVSRIRSVNADWRLIWVRQLKFDVRDNGLLYLIPSPLNLKETQHCDFKFFNSLAALCSNIIVDHLIVEELDFHSVGYVKIPANSQLMDLLPSTPLSKLTKAPEAKTHKLKLALHNHGNLFPVSNSSNTLLLVVSLTSVNHQTCMHLQLQGCLRQISTKISTAELEALELRVNDARDTFEICDAVNLSERVDSTARTMPKSQDHSETRLLSNIFAHLDKFRRVLELMNLLELIHVQVMRNTVHDVHINISDLLSPLCIMIPENSPTQIRMINDSSQTPAHGILDCILVYMNRSLAESLQPSNTEIVMALFIQYLQAVVPILHVIEIAKETLGQVNDPPKLRNGLSKLDFNVCMPSLDLIQFVFYLNHFAPQSPKKVLKDKIFINIGFRQNPFNTNNSMLINVSLKNNLHSKNLKHKSLFELIFKAIHDFEIEIKKQSAAYGTTPKENGLEVRGAPVFVKLNYDFLVDIDRFEEIIVKILQCFATYIRLS